MEKDFLPYVRLIEDCIAEGIFFRDANNSGNIMVYQKAGTPRTLNPEGWYSRNILDIAEELQDDMKSARIVEKELCTVQLSKANPAIKESGRNSYNEPEWYVDFENGKSLKIVHEEDGLSRDEQYYRATLYYSDEEYSRMDRQEQYDTMGICLEENLNTAEDVGVLIKDIERTDNTKVKNGMEQDSAKEHTHKKESVEKAD